MGMPLPLPTYTVKQVRAFPQDGQRYELVEGMLLVTPAPASDHQVVVTRLLAALHGYLDPVGLAYGAGPGEIEMEPNLHLEPDVLVFPSRFRPGTRWADMSDWWLAVEVLSPSSRFYDRDYKRDAYLRVGVREVWLVDLSRRQVEISVTPGQAPARVTDMLDWHPREMAAPFTLTLSTLFRDLL